MKTTIDFLNDVKKKHNLPSDYALAGKLGLSRAAISKFRVGKDCLGDETACKIAALLDLDPGYVMACIAAERAKKPSVKAAWKHTAEVLYGIAAVVAVVALLPTVPLPSYDGFNVALANVPETGALYIMSN